MKITSKLIALMRSGIPLGYLILHYLKLKVIYKVFGFCKTGKFYSIHPSSCVKCLSKLHAGKGFVIYRNAYVDALSRDGVVFGDGCSVGMNTVIQCTSLLNKLGKGLIVGHNTGLGTHSFYGCAGGVTLGDNVMVGNYVSFHSENHIFADKNKTIREQGVTHEGIVVGNDCWIGAKATILDGTIIEDGCVVAAGAVCRGYYPKNSIIAGVPAKVIKVRE